MYYHGPESINNKLLIIIPTYNEAENIELLLNTIFAITSPASAAIDILVIDDNSPDGTAAIVESIKPAYSGRLHLLTRENKQGGATAFLWGFSWGISNGYPLLLAMDADFSHDPQYIPLMLREISSHDMVIGSRNVKGAMIKNRSWIRNLITRCASLYCRVVLGCPLRDFTGGYNMYRKEVFEKIHPDQIQCRGYSFQIELKYKAYRSGLRLKEIPIVFPDRKKGKSKMSKKFLFESIRDVIKIKKMVPADTGIDQFIKFGITGTLGAITNLLIFFLCVDILQLLPTPVSAGCFLIAGTQNYIINHKWSFRYNTAGEKTSLKKWLFFLSASTLGLCINLLTLNLLLRFFILPYKFIAQAAGIVFGMLMNFFVSKTIVFRKKYKM